MRRRWLLALCAIAAAQQPHRESLRHREKRHARVLRELADHDRAQITEMHAQGLQPHHIAAELGLPGLSTSTRRLMLSTRAKRPSKGTRRHKAQPRQAPSLSPSDRRPIGRGSGAQAERAAVISHAATRLRACARRGDGGACLVRDDARV